jgi:hypothetical protein
LSMNHGYHITRLNALVRRLQSDSADSLADKKRIYELATEIMLEANHIRGIMDERRTTASYIFGRALNLLGFRRVRK